MALEAVVEVTGLHTRFGDNIVHRGVSLAVQRGEVFAVAGSSGCGKSTLLREILMLKPPEAGSIKVFGREVVGLEDRRARDLRGRFGVMFERGALFSALTVRDNVGMPLAEHTDLGKRLIDEVAELKLGLVGLPPGTGDLYPSELSGGMRKRAAMARALALDPELLFLDEPTAGLDPHSAAGIDELVVRLQALLGLTMMVITHDVDSLWRVADRVAVLGEGRVLGIGSMHELAQAEHPFIREYFYGPRGRPPKE